MRLKTLELGSVYFVGFLLILLFFVAELHKFGIRALSLNTIFIYIYIY